MLRGSFWLLLWGSGLMCLVNARSAMFNGPWRRLFVTDSVQRCFTNLAKRARKTRQQRPRLRGSGQPSYRLHPAESRPIAQTRGRRQSRVFLAVSLSSNLPIVGWRVSQRIREAPSVGARDRSVVAKELGHAASAVSD